ncbi:hypothetical protein IGI04_019048 [Brassica rapa subsp. trilocularis]|uniref:Uncharacterized protein n=1 Tax=Brassica rapa subsp. trilocularis TaxID=1813537 RepID=A0ABQ7MEQ7_BRACM|nr:hypothetical protein IGI04_019048 [Brassica rapa subsp. trilocularis]
MSRDLVVLVDPAVYGGGWCHDEVGLTGFGEKSESLPLRRWGRVAERGSVFSSDLVVWRQAPVRDRRGESFRVTAVAAACFACNNRLSSCVVAQGGLFGSPLGHWSEVFPWETCVRIGLPSTSVIRLDHFGGLIFGLLCRKDERHQDVALTTPVFLLSRSSGFRLPVVVRDSWLQRLGLAKLRVFEVNHLEQRCGQADFYQGVVSCYIKGFFSCGNASCA